MVTEFQTAQWKVWEGSKYWVRLVRGLMGIEVVTAEWGKLEHLVETEANGCIACSKLSPRGRISTTLVRPACGW